MFNRFLPAVAVGFALLIGGATVADAATKDEIKEQKGHVKMLAKELKTFDKLVGKWNKGMDKGKDVGGLNPDLVEICKRNLGWLRGTHNVDKNTEATDDNKWNIAFRDVLMDVKHTKDKDVKKKQMNKMSQMLKTRLERHEKKLGKMSA